MSDTKPTLKDKAKEQGSEDAAAAPVAVAKFKLCKGIPYYHCSLNVNMQTVPVKMEEGKEYDLPTENQHVKNLIAKGFIERVKK